MGFTLIVTSFPFPSSLSFNKPSLFVTVTSPFLIFGNEFIQLDIGGKIDHIAACFNEKNDTVFCDEPDL